MSGLRTAPKAGAAASTIAFAAFDAAAQFLGSVGLNQRNRAHNFMNLGYWMRASQQGNGIAVRAARLVAAFGFGQVGLTRIEIVAALDNRASRRVAERSGAVFEAIARNRLVDRGNPIDAALYALVPADKSTGPRRSGTICKRSVSSGRRSAGCLRIRRTPRAAATRAMRIARQAQFAERRRERIEAQQASDQRLADIEDQLDRLARLQQADDAGQHAEHAGLRAVRRIFGGRRLGKQAAVARRVRRRAIEHADLTGEAMHRAVHERNLQLPGRGVEQVARREIVGAIDDDIVSADQRFDIPGAQALVARVDARRAD